MSRSSASEDLMHRAFILSSAALIYVPTAAEASETKRFIVQSPAYYNLQAYITVGLGLPASTAAFDSEYPISQLADLTALDPYIYNDIRNAMVNVNNHTSGFQRNSMHKFLTVTSVVLSFCREFEYTVEGSLKRDFAILGDPSGSRSRIASLRSSMHLRRLEATAAQCELVCMGLVQDLTALLGQTVSVKVDVDELHRKFITHGPGNGRPPYSNQLQGSLADLRREAAKYASEYQSQKNNYDHYVVVAATTPSYGWFWPFGTIAAAAVAAEYGQKAVNAKNAYERAAASLNANNDRQRSLTRCIDLVTSMTAELNAIHQTIQKAIDGMRAMQAMFARLTSDLGSIAESCRSMRGAATGDDEFMKALIWIDLDLALSAYAEVSILAQSFLNNSSINWN